MNISELSRQLKTGWYSIYILAAVTLILFETGVLRKGTVTDNGTLYILEVVAVGIALAVIPLALRGLKRMMDRFDGSSDERRLSVYKTCAWLRLAAFFVVIEYSVVLYYIINDDIGIYCAVIGAICSMFCFPSEGNVEYELNLPED